VARGVDGHSPPEDFPAEELAAQRPRLRIAFLRDPDGNLLELVQPLSSGSAAPQPSAGSGSAQSRQR
jgi:hypothetical protein